MMMFFYLLFRQVLSLPVYNFDGESEFLLIFSLILHLIFVQMFSFHDSYDIYFLITTNDVYVTP